MTETNQPETNRPQLGATPVVEKKRRLPSAVWLMPLLALVVAFGVVWNNYTSRGPLITIVLENASGIRAGATEVRIRDLRVGIVEQIGFSRGMGAVEVGVRMDKGVAEYVDADAQFWPVQPKVTTRGVTGIDTLLSGVYIAASWDGEPGAPQDRFIALETPPLAAPGEKGTRIVLRTRSGGQLAAGAPVLTSGIEVGRIGTPVLSQSGTTVTMDAFILAPYDKRLTTSARFWDASGVSLNVGTGGVALRVDSLASLLEGGVTFGTPVTGGKPVEDGHVFDVFPDQNAAREDAFEADASPDIFASIMLDADVKGLGLGTIVRYRGVKVGEVEDVVGIAPPAGSEEAVKLRIDLRLSSTRLGFDADMPVAEIRKELEERVENGLRARVSSEGLFGQTVIIELAQLRFASDAKVTYDPLDRLMLPTTAASKASADEGINGLVTRLTDLPIEELMDAATQALSNVSGLTSSAQDFISSDAVTAIPETVDQTLADARALVAQVRAGGAIENFNATMQSASNTLGTIETAAKTLPETVEQTLSQVNALVSDLRTGGTLDNLNTALKSADETLKSVTGAANSVPQTIDKTLSEVDALVAKIRTGGTLDSVNSALQSVSATLKSIEGSSSTLPETIDTTLVQLRDLISELRAGGAVESLNQTLLSANNALKSVDLAASSLPDLAKRLNTTASGLDAVVAGYSTKSKVYKDAQATLRQISSMAESFRSLARSIERNPSSLIRGR